MQSFFALLVLKYFFMRCNACNLYFAVQQIFSTLVIKLTFLSIVTSSWAISWDFSILFPSTNGFRPHLFPISWTEIYQGLVFMSLSWTILRYVLNQTWDYVIYHLKFSHKKLLFYHHQNYIYQILRQWKCLWKC